MINRGFDQIGFTIVSQVISSAERSELLSEIGTVNGAGRRGMLALPVVAKLTRSPQILEIIRPHLPATPFAVRAIYFSKTRESNWLVTWHQDVTVAVREQADVPGFGPWSVKEGIPHVQPPTALLEQMIAVRLHLDDADSSNGALRVLPGTHRHGRLSASQIEDFRGKISEVVCAAAAGDGLLMRPLLLHASSRSNSANPRRVLHIEYASFKLPAGLEWHDGA